MALRREDWQWADQPDFDVVARQDFSAQLIFAYLPNIGPVNLATGQSPTSISGLPQTSAISSGRAYPGGYTAQFPTPVSLTNGITCVSVWRARAASNYLSGDGHRSIFGNRTSTGFQWGRTGAVAGGAGGNTTRQQFTLFGILDYNQTAYTIESLIPTPVAVRYRRAAGAIQFWQFGAQVESMPASTTPNAGGNLVFGEAGPYGGAIRPWIDQASVLLVFAGELSDAELAMLTEDANAPYRAFEPRQILVPFTAAPTGPTVTALTPTTIGSTSHRPRYTWTP